MVGFVGDLERNGQRPARRRSRRWSVGVLAGLFNGVVVTYHRDPVPGGGDGQRVPVPRAGPRPGRAARSFALVKAQVLPDVTTSWSAGCSGSRWSSCGS